MKNPIYLFYLFKGCMLISKRVPNIIFSCFSRQHIDSIKIFSIPSKNMMRFLKLTTNGKYSSFSSIWLLMNYLCLNEMRFHAFFINCYSKQSGFSSYYLLKYFKFFIKNTNYSKVIPSILLIWWVDISDIWFVIF